MKWWRREGGRGTLRSAEGWAAWRPEFGRSTATESEVRRCRRTTTCSGTNTSHSVSTRLACWARERLGGVSQQSDRSVAIPHRAVRELNTRDGLALSGTYQCPNRSGSAGNVEPRTPLLCFSQTQAARPPCPPQTVVCRGRPPDATISNFIIIVQVQLHLVELEGPGAANDSR